MAGFEARLIAVWLRGARQAPRPTALGAALKRFSAAYLQLVAPLAFGHLRCLSQGILGPCWHLPSGAAAICSHDVTQPASKMSDASTLPCAIVRWAASFVTSCCG